MLIVDLLLHIEKVAKEYKLSRPFIVGGVPRDRLFGIRGNKSEIKDIDITTGDDDIHRLSQILSKLYKDNNYRTYDDGHSSIDIMGLHIDFSSNFFIPNIKNELESQGVKNITPMKMEIYSRDFTINTLLESMDFDNIYDLTTNGISDIKSRLLRCPINPEITIGIDPRRILRAIKFSIKFNLKIEDKLKVAIINHKDKLSQLPKQFLQTKLNEIVAIDDEKGIDKLIEFKIFSAIEPTKTIYDMLIQKRKLLRVL